MQDEAVKTGTMRPERKESTGSGDRSSGLWNMGGEGTGHHSQPGHLDTWMYRAPLTEKMDPKGTCQPPAGGPERFPLGTLDPVQPASGAGALHGGFDESRHPCWSRCAA